MKFLQTLNRFVQGVLFLLIPIILFYWFLSVTNLELLKPVTVILYVVFNPLISLIKLFGAFEIPYDNKIVDFSTLILAGLVLSCAFISMGIDKMLVFIENSANAVRKRSWEKEIQKKKDIERVKHFEEMAKNKVIYLVLKFNKKENNTAYLYGQTSSGADDTIDSAIKDMLDYSSNFSGRKYDKSENNSNCHYFTFYDVTDGIDYAFYIFNRLNQLNSEISSTGQGLTASVGCHCSYNEITAKNDFLIAEKVGNLAGNLELVVSELFKNKYRAMKAESNLKFVSKGIYCVDDNNIEIFQIMVDPIKN